MRRGIVAEPAPLSFRRRVTFLLESCGPRFSGNLIFAGSRTDHRSGYATEDAAATPAGGTADWWWVILLVIVAAVAIWYFTRRRTPLRTDHAVVGRLRQSPAV
jgi:hypothetical protein